MAKKGNLTNRQKAVIHQAAQKLGLIRNGDDGQYRLVLGNVTGGKRSSSEMTQADYDKLIAWFSSQGVNIGSGNPQSKSENPKSGGGITSRQLKRIADLSGAMPDVNVSGVIKQCLGTVTAVEDLASYEASRVISALQAMSKRAATVRERVPLAGDEERTS